MAHGSGGESTSRLIEDVFAKYFNNEFLSELSDSAVVPGSSKLAITTDSFVVTPILFPGGDIGRLSVCGTVNDLLMSGAVPKYITCGCILEEGLDMEILEKVIASMAETAKEAGPPTTGTSAPAAAAVTVIAATAVVRRTRKK